MLFKQVCVVFPLFIGGEGGRASIDDFLAIPADEGAAVVAVFGSDGGDTAAIEVRSEDVDIALVHGEGHVLTVRVDGGFGDVSVDIDHFFELARFEFLAVEAEFRIDLPNIAFGHVDGGLGATVLFVGAGEVDVFSIGGEIGAGGASEAGGDEFAVAAVGIHDIDLFVGVFGLAGLEDDLGALEVPVGFGVLSAKGELADIFKVLFFRIGFMDFAFWPLADGESFGFLLLGGSGLGVEHGEAAGILGGLAGEGQGKGRDGGEHELDFESGEKGEL